MHHGGRGDQSTGRRGHHRSHASCQCDATDANGKNLDCHGSECIIADVDSWQQHRGSHADDGTDNSEENAVNTISGSTQSGYARGLRSEYALPNILANKQPQGVDDKVGNY